MTRLLFVDDEPEILAGLRTMLRPHHTEWQMEFVDSGAAAIAEFKKAPFDLLCTDMRMPQMDGAQLLAQVAEQWPQTIRIVLSGHAELTQTIRLVPIAHQYLSKPCDVKRLEGTIQQCLNMRALLGRANLRAMVGRVKKLPASPKAYQALCAAMARTETTGAEIAKIVAKDTAIAARVLQVVNSAFFRLPRQIAKIEQAVSYLGFTAIRNLALSAEVFSAGKPTTTLKGFDLTTLQTEAIKTAAVMRALTKDTPLADDAFVVGLLHNIGVLIFLDICPDKLKTAGDESLTTGAPLHEMERKHIGATQGEVGAYLLALWGLPYSIIEAVAYQHTPEHGSRMEFDLLAALVIALTTLAEGKQLQRSPSLHIDTQYLESVHAPFSLDEARTRAHAVVLAGEPST